MIIQELHGAIESAHLSLETLRASAVTELTKELKIDEAVMMLLLTLQTYGSDPIAPDMVVARFPFTSVSLIKNHMQQLTKLDLLNPGPGDCYTLSQKGNTLCKKISQALSNSITGILPLSAVELMDMASRLKEISDACLAEGEPPQKCCVIQQRKLDPGVGAPIMVRIDQFIKEILAYRDDSHSSAWKAYGVDAHAWEILTLLWQVNQLDRLSLFEQLAGRGFSSDDTYSSIELLSKRGWIVTANDEIKISPFGSEIRRIAENTTNRYFYTPWQLFDEPDLTQLLTLVENFRRGIPA
jgi:hypothetical protein